MAAPPPSVLREFCPLYYLLNAIPAKRGFRSVLVYLTAVDSSKDFVAVGSSIGMIYLFCRQHNNMHRYSLEGKSDAITAVKLLSCFDDLVAVGTASGRVAVFQLVSPLPAEGPHREIKPFCAQLRRFDVVGLHKGSVTALAWSTNGMKLFSGDDKGRVVFSSLDLDQSDLQVFAARPGLRLWRSDVRGQVEDTRLLRALFSTQIPQFELFPRPGPIGAYRPAERQLGLLSCFLREGWILSWNEYSVYVLDCLNEVIVGALESSGDIVSVSSCDNEIFILKGDRDIIRLSSSAEGQASSLVDVHLSSPLATPTTLPPIGSVETAQPIRTMAIIIEGGGREEGGGWERPSEEGEREGEEEVEEAMEQLEEQDSSCSEGGSGTPLSDRTSLIGLDLQNQDSPEQDQNLPDAGVQGAVESGSSPPPNSLIFQGLQNQQNPAETVPPTPDVDLLLECTFSYMHNTDGGGQEPQPMEDQDQFLSPLIGREDEEAKDEDLAAPSGLAEQIFYSTTGDNLNGPSSETADRQVEQDPQDRDTHRPDQLAESWMGYSGPGCGILSLQVTDRYVWCLDFKGGLFCSSLPETGLNWQRFEDNVHQVAVSPSQVSCCHHSWFTCNLLWKVEQKTLTAFACAKVSAKGKRHWYKATEQTAFVALSATLPGSSGPTETSTCRQVSVWSVPVLALSSQVCVSGGAVWALSEHKALFYREGVTSYCSEGGGWKGGDSLGSGRQRQPLVQNWDLSIQTSGGGRPLYLGLRGLRSGKPDPDSAGSDQSVATVTRAPVERVVAFLSQHSQCQPSLVSANQRGVWVASGRNQLHLARGSLVGTFWQNVVPRGTVSSTRWTFITSSAVPHREGSLLWLAQSRKDLFCVWDQDGELRPSSVPLPPEMEVFHLSACPDALWVLDSQGRVSIRTLSPSCPSGLSWTLLDLSQLGSVRLVSVSCGRQNVWAVDGRGNVYFRVGTQPMNPSMMLPAWIQIEPPVQPIGVLLVSVQTSPNDRLLWALDNRGSVLVRTGLSDEMPVGTDWEAVPGLLVSQLVLSCRTVLVRCPNGDVARRYGVSDRNPAGDYWKKIPGNTNWLTGPSLSGDDDEWELI
ncbi:Tectonin beta-propeller repeat-containing protein 2 [Dissostichus eleginoides]|uniref:Tectonin beta-propeller repeat-containing protein 2 n=1 Tax=Dissostichus eleginoides TaxID=100907 RepID=A0AAD9F2H8_DISEL|nr:Tectonin beta-propeller repeat-containing protein 2 [Dissostichus eleginoides]